MYYREGLASWENHLPRLLQLVTETLLWLGLDSDPLEHELPLDTTVCKYSTEIRPLSTTFGCFPVPCSVVP